MTSATEAFDPAIVKWRITSTSKDKTRGMVVGYVDARAVMERLDALDATWSDYYREVGDKGAVECVLHVGETTRTDVGYPNGPDDEEPFKGAYSDALKRAAVKFGIGRDLYELPKFWVPIDEYKKPTVLPQYVTGKGWVLPQAGQQAPTPVEAPEAVEPRQPTEKMATAPMLAKLRAMAREKGMDQDALKFMLITTVGKDSTKKLTYADIDKLFIAIGQYEPKAA